MEKVPEEKKAGVEKRVEEVVHEHRELGKKLRTKEEVGGQFGFSLAPRSGLFAESPEH